MNVNQAYRYGSDTGYEIAREILIRNPSMNKEEFHSECSETETNSRQFTPFEVFAGELNASEYYSDGLWEAYERGVHGGIGFVWQRRRKILNGAKYVRGNLPSHWGN